MNKIFFPFFTMIKLKIIFVAILLIDKIKHILTAVKCTYIIIYNINVGASIMKLYALNMEE